VSPATAGASPHDVTGRLTCAGSGVGGATITFTWYKSGLGLNPNQATAKILSPAVTNTDGTYSVTGSVCAGAVALDKYLEFRKANNENIINTSPLFRDTFDPIASYDDKENIGRSMTAHAIRQYGRLLQWDRFLLLHHHGYHKTAILL
jgi:hypothetical protein